MRSWMQQITVARALLAIVVIVAIARNMCQTTLPVSLLSDALARARERGLNSNEQSIDRFVNIGPLLVRSQLVPEHVKVKKGQHAVWHLTNLERTRDATHGFTLSGYGLSASLEPGKTVTLEFVADKEGVYSFYCPEFCSALHLEMMGYLLVGP